VANCRHLRGPGESFKDMIISTTTFTLNDVNFGAGALVVDSTTSVMDADPAVAPTISGTTAGQTTTSEAPVRPFAHATIGDANLGRPTR
jgi:hypothetical protein